MELWRLLLNYSGWLALIVAVAAWVPAGQWLALALLAIWLLREKYRLVQLRSWLRAKDANNSDLPVASGKWGEVYNSLYQRFQRVNEQSMRYHSFMRRIQRIATRMDDAVMLLDGAMRIVWFNRSARELFTFSSGAKDVGLPVYHVVRQQRFGEFLSSEAESMEWKFDGRQLEARKIWLTDNSLMLLLRDFSRQQQLDQMRKDFTANISHELRTPLSVLFGYLEQIEEQPDLSPESAQAVAVMLAQCQRMTKLFNDLTTLSRIELDHDQASEASVDMVALLQRLEDESRILNKGHNHRISFQCHSSAGLRADESQLISAFSNLIANAIYYTKNGGEIEVSWGVDSLGRGLFSVRDNGMGIAEKHLSRISERFFRADAAPMHLAGVGLGLSITKRALKNHDGELRVSSRLGQGSKFTCYFSASRLLSAGDHDSGASDAQLSPRLSQQA